MERGKLSREIAISKALEITYKKGINQLTYNGLARALDIQPQSLYRYLKNISDVKSEVIAAIINKWANELQSQLKRYQGKEYLMQFALYFYNAQEEIFSTEILTALSKYQKNSSVQEAVANLHALPAQVIKTITKEDDDLESNITLYINYLAGSAITKSFSKNSNKNIFMNNIKQILSDLN